MYPKWVQQEQERQQKYPDWFDQQTQSIDRQKVDQDARPIVEEKYKQALQYGQNFVTNLDQGIQKMQKDYILSFVLREFSKLFMTISTYDAGHFGNDFSLDTIQSTTNGTVRLKGRLSARKMGMDYSLATGELRVDDFLYQQFPGGNFSIDPASPGKYKLNGTLASFDTEYKDKPPIDLTNIIQKNTDPKTIQNLAQEHTKLSLDKHYKSSHNAELQPQVIAMVEKNKIVQDWLKLFVP